MKIHFVYLLFVVLSATVLSQDANIKPRYEKFITQHIYGKMTAEKCDKVIQKRRITKTNSNNCKETNTFIKASTKMVKQICQNGEANGNNTKSRKPFRIFVCNLKNQNAKYPKCQYRGKAFTRRIIVTCEHGFPVHYVKAIGRRENGTADVFNI